MNCHHEDASWRFPVNPRYVLPLCNLYIELFQARNPSNCFGRDCMLLPPFPPRPSWVPVVSSVVPQHGLFHQRSWMAAWHRCQVDHEVLFCQVPARWQVTQCLKACKEANEPASDERAQRREVQGEREEEKPRGMRWKWVIWQVLPPGQSVIKAHLAWCLHWSVCQSFPVAFSHSLSVSLEITFLDQLWRLNSGSETWGARQSASPQSALQGEKRWLLCVDQIFKRWELVFQGGTRFSKVLGSWQLPSCFSKWNAPDELQPLL